MMMAGTLPGNVRLAGMVDEQVTGSTTHPHPTGQIYTTWPQSELLDLSRQCAEDPTIELLLSFIDDFEEEY